MMFLDMQRLQEIVRDGSGCNMIVIQVYRGGHEVGCVSEQT